MVIFGGLVGLKTDLEGFHGDSMVTQWCFISEFHRDLNSVGLPWDGHDSLCQSDGRGCSIETCTRFSALSRARVLSSFTEMMMASCSGAGYQGISEKLNTPWTTPTSASNAACAFPSTSLQPAAAALPSGFFCICVNLCPGKLGIIMCNVLYCRLKRLLANWDASSTGFYDI